MPVISESAPTLAMVSENRNIMTTVMEITPTTGNSGLPKWNGVTTAMSRGALATMPRARALSPKAMTTTMAAIPMYSGRA